MEHYQDNIVFGGKIYLGEIYYKIKQSDVRLKRTNDEFRDLSQNQMCFGVTMSDGKIFAKIESFVKTNKEKSNKNFCKTYYVKILLNT